MQCVGLIGGSGLLHAGEGGFLAGLTRKEIWTPEGHCVIVRTGELPGAATPTRLVFVQRHQADPSKDYVQPAKIHYAAIADALVAEGCSVVVGVCSVGALHSTTPLGSLSVPGDFWCPWDLRSGYDDYRSHFVPGYDEELRAQIVEGVKAAGFDVTNGGVYANSKGPRFETKAEIRFFAQNGDIIGMTGAHEATACGERRLPYACLCIVDNMAHGLATEQLTVEGFKQVQKENEAKVLASSAAALVQVANSLATRPAATGAGAGAGAGSAAAASGKTAVDLVVKARFVVCVEPQGVLENHAVVVKDGNIVEVLPSAECDAKYTATIEEELAEHVVTPGLVNAHAHSPMVFLRGLADDLPLLEWLTTAVWPTEGKFVDPTFVAEGAVHAAAEMILGGTTTVNDMYFFPKEIAEALAGRGMRVSEGMIVIEFPSAYASNTEEYFTKNRAMYDEITARQRAGDKAAKRISFTVSAHAPYTVCDASFAKVKELSEELDIPVHIHLHETHDECHLSANGIDGLSRHRSDEVCRPFKNMDRLGLVNKRLIAVHMTQLEDDEIATLAAKGGHVVHCPSSNLKLASGFCRVADLVKAGVNVALGTDGACSNNSLDLVAEMKLAAILAKAVGKDAAAVPARHALRMATINGARALGLGDRIGSLEPGKAADFVAFKLSGLASLPLYNVESHLVYTATADTVTDVWVDGDRLLRNRTLTTIDAAAVAKTAKEWGQKLAAHKAEMAAAAAASSDE